MDLVNSLLPRLEDLQFWGYWVFGLICLGESLAFIGLVIPGTTFCILVGFSAARGYFQVSYLIWFAIIGSLIGDMISYTLGRNAHRFFDLQGKLYQSGYFKRGEAFFIQHGGKGLFLGRFFGPLRPILPFVAGIFKMKLRFFLTINTTSACGWATLYVLLGYFFGQAWQMIEIWSTRVSILLLCFLVIILIFYQIKSEALKRGKDVSGFLKSLGQSTLAAVVNNPRAQAWVARHPRLWNQLKARTNLESLAGLPLTLVSIALIYVFALFLGLVENIFSSASLLAADWKLENLLYIFRHPMMVKFFLWITLLAKGEIVVSALTAVSIILWMRNKKAYILPAWITVGGAELFAFLGKVAFHRPRPALSIYIENFFSFPSGHAAAAAAFYGFLSFIFWRQLKNPRWQLNSLFGGLLIIGAVGFSRLYLGAHYLSDVLAGYALGAFWLLIGVSLTQEMSLKLRTAAPRYRARSVTVLTAILIAVELVFYLQFGLRYQPELKMPVAEEKKLFSKAEITVGFANYNLPRYTESVIGGRQEPLSFLISARDDQELLDAFGQAGWALTDPITPYSLYRVAQSTLFTERYPTAPITPTFWNNKIYDFGFAKPLTYRKIKGRYHAEFWRMNLKTADGHSIYVGTVGAYHRMQLGSTHRLKPDIDSARRELLKDFRLTGLLSSEQEHQFVKAQLGQNDIGDKFYTDGKIVIVKIQPPKGVETIPQP